MSELIRRIKRRVEYTASSFRADCRFSFELAFLRLGDELGGRLGLRTLSDAARERKNEWLQQYLRDCLRDVLVQFEEDAAPGDREANAPIWICWWTGEETAPPLVRQCIKSIRRNAGEHPVYLITEYNYREYVDIPLFITEKVKKGQMGLAHLADYIRVKLLAEKGGLWLDATIFCSAEVPALCFELPVFTCKGPVRESTYISQYRWTTFCLGGWKGNVFYRYLTAAFEQYWLTNSRAVDYLFFDHVIFLAYHELPAVRRLLDAVPENNLHRDDLQAAMNAALPATQFSAVLQPDTALYKLSWREVYSESNGAGQRTIYGEYFCGGTEEKNDS